MTMLPDADIGSGSVRFAKDYVGVDYHNDGPQSHRRPLLTSPSTAPLRRRCRSSRSPREVPRPARSTSSGTVSSGAGCCSTCLACGASRGSSRGSTCSARTSRRRSASRASASGAGDILLVRTGHARRRAELPPWDTDNAKAGPASDHRVLPGGAVRRRARLGRQQRHRPEHHRGGRFPDPRPRAQRDGHPPARLPAVRGPRPTVRGGAALGVPVRRGAAANRRRDGIAAQPDRDLLSVPWRWGGRGAPRLAAGCSI